MENEIEQHHHHHEHHEHHEHHHSHGSEHSHHHHHHHDSRLKSLNAIFVIGIVLNALFVAVEAAVGLWTDSLSLLSDAGHNLSDVFSLVLAMLAFKLAKVPATKKYTYGYRKSTILISLLNAVILLVAVGVIVVESIGKIFAPAPIDGNAVSITAGIGIVVNGLTAILLLKSQKNDLNVRGAFLHMLADTLVSVGVVASGLIIAKTDIYIIDPILSLVIAAVILVSTWGLLAESVTLALDAIPHNTNAERIQSILERSPKVKNVHHLHIWGISTTDVALTAHIVIDDLNAMEQVKDEIKHALQEAGIGHSTLEFETSDSHCDQHECAIPEQ
ncbi:MAG: cation transporter [Bacteroidales bacterium]|nr:cation transporter [Bacteroidales bacterium]